MGAFSVNALVGSGATPKTGIGGNVVVKKL